MLLAVAVLAGQVLRLQLLGPVVAPSADPGYRMRLLPIEPSRGLIYDRTGTPLAVNVPEFAVVLVPADVPRDNAGRRLALLALERETGVPYGEIETLLNAGERSADPLSAVTVRSGIGSQDAIAMRAALAAVPGVHVRATPVRQYEGGDLLPHILGSVGLIAPEEADGYLAQGYPLDARVGRSGVEATYEEELRGGAGRLLVVADPTGRQLDVLGALEPVPGVDVVLSIDLGLQAAAMAALRDGIEAGLPDARERAELDGRDPPQAAGAVVVLDVRSGELLALVSYPSYEASILAGSPGGSELERLLADPASPLIHRAYMDVRAPGSIFKVLVAAAALQEGVATPQTRITSTGSITVQDQYDPETSYVFGDWAAHGTLDLYGGIARSSDVYFYYLAGGYEQTGEQPFEGLGADRIAKYARAAGLGAPTGLDLPGEASGLAPDRAWKERTVGEPWVLGDTYTLGIGQGYLAVTPLQMAVAGAAIANGGEVLVPRVVHALQRGTVTEVTPKVVARRLPVDAEHLAVVREAMRRAAAPGGTAVRGQPAGMDIGGKTGTAEFGTRYPDGSLDAHGWFLGFAPFEEPEIAIAVYIEHGVGAQHAAPVARVILEAYFGDAAVAR